MFRSLLQPIIIATINYSSCSHYYYNFMYIYQSNCVILLQNKSVRTQYAYMKNDKHNSMSSILNTCRCAWLYISWFVHIIHIADYLHIEPNADSVIIHNPGRGFKVFHSHTNRHSVKIVAFKLTYCSDKQYPTTSPKLLESQWCCHNNNGAVTLIVIYMYI